MSRIIKELGVRVWITWMKGGRRRIHKYKSKSAKFEKLSALSVALEGLEPSLKVPETCVLPLHHKALSVVARGNYRIAFCLKIAILDCCLPSFAGVVPFDTAKLVLFLELTKFSGNFFQEKLWRSGYSADSRPVGLRSAIQCISRWQRPSGPRTRGARLA